MQLMDLVAIDWGKRKNSQF